MCTSKWYRNNILTAHAIVGNIVLSAPWKYSEAITKVSRKYSGIIRKVFEKYSQKYWKTIRKFFENYLKNWSANMCLNTCSKYSENIQIILRKYSESFQHFWRVWLSILNVNNSPSITRIRGSSHVISELSIAGRQGTNGEGKADSQSLYSSSKMQRHYLARPKTKLQFERTLIIYFVNYRRTYVCNK